MTCMRATKRKARSKKTAGRRHTRIGARVTFCLVQGELSVEVSDARGGSIALTLQSFGRNKSFGLGHRRNFVTDFTAEKLARIYLANTPVCLTRIRINLIGNASEPQKRTHHESVAGVKRPSTFCHRFSHPGARRMPPPSNADSAQEAAPPSKSLFFRRAGFRTENLRQSGKATIARARRTQHAPESHALT